MKRFRPSFSMFLLQPSLQLGELLLDLGPVGAEFKGSLEVGDGFFWAVLAGEEVAGDGAGVGGMVVDAEGGFQLLDGCVGIALAAVGEGQVDVVRGDFLPLARADEWAIALGFREGCLDRWILIDRSL